MAFANLASGSAVRVKRARPQLEVPSALWPSSEVMNWLESRRLCDEVLASFNGFTGRDLLTLTLDDFVGVGLSQLKARATFNLLHN